MYGIANTRKLDPVTNYSFIFNQDVENGTIMFKGEVTAESQVYNAVLPTTATLKQKAYLVAHPASFYDVSRSTNQNRQNFINAKGVPFRVYELKEERKFDVTTYTIDGVVAKDAYVTAQNGSGRLVVSASAPDPDEYGFIGKITDVFEKGFFYPVGVGEELLDGADLFGVGIDGRIEYATIEVVQNV